MYRCVFSKKVRIISTRGYKMNNENNKDGLSRRLFLLSNAIPPVGIFLYFKHRKLYPAKASQALKGALLGIPPAIVIGHLMNTYIFN